MIVTRHDDLSVGCERAGDNVVVVGIGQNRGCDALNFDELGERGTLCQKASWLRSDAGKLPDKFVPTQHVVQFCQQGDTRKESNTASPGRI
jgi:hypothetical protein